MTATALTAAWAVALVAFLALATRRGADAPAVRNAGRVVLALALAHAARARCTELDLVRFTVDQTVLVDGVRDILSGKRYPALGPPIGPELFDWGHLGPFQYYALALLSAPLVPRVGLIDGAILAWVLASLASIPLTGIAGTRRLGRVTGVVGASLLAAAPFPWFLSRELINMGLLPPVLALFLLALGETTHPERSTASRSRWAVLTCATLAAALQLHVTVGVLLPVLAAALVAGRVRPWAWAGGLAAGAAVYAPYLAEQLRTGFADVRATLAVLTGAAAGLEEARVGVGPVLALAHDALVSVGHPPSVSPPPGYGPLGLAEAAAVVLGAAVVAASLRRAGPGERAWPAALLAWAILPLAYLATFRGPPFVRYLAPWYPVPFLLAGRAVQAATVEAAAAVREDAVRAWRLAPLARAAAGALALGAIALSAGWVASQATLVQRYRTEARLRGHVSAGPSLRVQRVAAWTLQAELGLTAEDLDRMHASSSLGGRTGLSGVSYLVRHEALAPDPGRSLPAGFGPGGTGRVLVLGRTGQVSDPLVRHLRAAGWLGEPALYPYRPGLDRDGLVVEWPGHPGEPPVPVPPGGLELAVEPRPFRLRGTLSPGPVHLLVVDGTGCLSRVRVGDETVHEESCAGRPPRPWAERDVFEVGAVPGAAAGPSPRPLVIEGAVGTGRLDLDVFDVPIPADGLAPHLRSLFEGWHEGRPLSEVAASAAAPGPDLEVLGPTPDRPWRCVAIGPGRVLGRTEGEEGLELRYVADAEGAALECTLPLPLPLRLPLPGARPGGDGADAGVPPWSATDRVHLTWTPPGQLAFLRLAARDGSPTQPDTYHAWDDVAALRRGPHELALALGELRSERTGRPYRPVHPREWVVAIHPEPESVGHDLHLVLGALWRAPAGG